MVTQTVTGVAALDLSKKLLIGYKHQKMESKQTVLLTECFILI